jgi:hypothetical protein
MKLLFEIIVALMLTGAILAKPVALGWKWIRSR